MLPSMSKGRLVCACCELNELDSLSTGVSEQRISLQKHS